MAGYSPAPLWRKLGYKDGIDAHVEGAPPTYRAALQLPAEVRVRWVSAPEPGIGFVHTFCREAVGLKKVCAVDDTWSGLKLVIRKSER